MKRYYVDSDSFKVRTSYTLIENSFWTSEEIMSAYYDDFDVWNMGGPFEEESFSSLEEARKFFDDNKFQCHSEPSRDHAGYLVDVDCMCLYSVEVDEDGNESDYQSIEEYFPALEN